jgi:hypothetical protein
MASLKSAIECRGIHHVARESRIQLYVAGRRVKVRIPPLPLNFHLDPPPGSRLLRLGFRAGRDFAAAENCK